MAREDVLNAGLQRMVTNGDVILVHQSGAARKSAPILAEVEQKQAGAGPEADVAIAMWPEAVEQAPEQAQLELARTQLAQAVRGRTRPAKTDSARVEPGEEREMIDFLPAPPGYAYEFGTGRLVPIRPDLVPVHEL